ncbi:MAG: glutamyl-tRNA reductase, partial [Desulfobacterales bacterium]|nr:glutamyl-tRNA reductase [Desulfobacterales bacterium]
MSKIILIGASHKTAPVELREKLAFSQEQIETALEFIKQDPGIREGLVFSTCNRLEFLYIPKSGDDDNNGRIDAVLAFISELKQLPVSQFKSSLYIHTDDEAVRHLFCVAASLDSMVVGEPQILGQVKKAYKTAVSEGTTGVLLNRLMHKSFSVA